MADEETKPTVAVHKGAEIKAPAQKMLFLKPVAGRRVRDPLIPTRILPPEGDYKPDNSFWQLRLHQGDVIEAEPIVAPKSSKVKE